MQSRTSLSFFIHVATCVFAFGVFGQDNGRAFADSLPEKAGIRGGVAVHVGCNNGQLTAELRTSERFLVHGLDTSSADIEKAKAYIDSLGLYGEVSAETYDGVHLPYGDNVVNVVVIEDPAQLTADEVMRVLTPGGVALVKSDCPLLDSSSLDKSGQVDGWTKYTKPWPKSIDEWTHFLYDATGNAVSKDETVGHPRHLQWYAGPKHTRHHDALASMSAMTSSDGRLFYILDEGPISVIHQPSKWRLIARDAFNGKLLWKREIPDWMTHLYNFRAGPQQLPRRLVSIDDCVYTTLGLTAPVTKLDAATGETLLTYPDSENAEELICHDGMLLVVKGDPSILIGMSDQAHGYWDLVEAARSTTGKSIIAYDARTGRRLWTDQGENVKDITPLSLCARDDRVYYLDSDNLNCLDAKTGQRLWASPFPTEGMFIRSYAPTVVIHDDVIVCLTWNRLFAFSADTGELLWQNKGAIGFGSPGDLFAIDGKAWLTPLTKSIWGDSKRNADGVITTGIPIPREEFLAEGKTGVAVDLQTGEIVEELPFAKNQHHHRCYRDKATERYFLIGYSGIQVVDRETKANATNQWVRGICQYGIMPANGYIYVPADPCQCYSSVKMNGFLALGEKNSTDGLPIRSALEKGPAYERASTLGVPSPNADADWPTYRANIRRSGAAGQELPERLATRWETPIGPSITAPVIAGERVYVAEKDAYAVHCLDRNTGKPQWKFLANGPIDSPPTIHGGLCLFGCGDGSVYCLDAKTGELAWRFKVSEIEHRIGSDDRLESPWPISGSVLVLDGTAYFAAGRSTNLDGGIRLYGIDVRTGEQLHHSVVASGSWDQGREGQISAGALADLLISNGQTISMRQLSVSKDLTKGGKPGSIMPITGLLDDSWFHRSDWSYDRNAGQLIVYDDTASYGVVNPYTRLKHQRKGQFAEYNQEGHLHIKFTRYAKEHFPLGSQVTASNPNARRGATDHSWTIDEQLQPRAMLLAGERLYLAGWLDFFPIELKTGRTKAGIDADRHESFLRVYAADSGEAVAEYPLADEPVFDGAAAAHGELFLSLKNGTVTCMGKAD